MDKYKEVVETLIRFRDERDWAQFHDSKNLALALLLEASELNELFLWKKESQAEEVNPERLKEELADVLTYSLLLAEKHHLDIFDIVLEKIRKNGEKYPVEKAACKLNPPVNPSISKISPVKYKPLTSLLSMVCGEISLT